MESDYDAVDGRGIVWRIELQQSNNYPNITAITIHIIIITVMYGQNGYVCDCYYGGKEDSLPYQPAQHSAVPQK